MKRRRGGAGEDVWRGGLIRYEHLACSISGHIALCEDISKQQLHHMTTHRQTDDGLLAPPSFDLHQIDPQQASPLKRKTNLTPPDF